MKLNFWGTPRLKRRTGWFLVLMVWVGMVTAVVVHQTPGDRSLSEVGPQGGLVEIETGSGLESIENHPPENIEQVTSSGDPVDVQQVEKEAKEEGRDFFVEYRIERDQARSEQINLLREMINNPNSEEELKSQAQERLLQITDNIEQEMEVESLIRARGYEDGIVFIHDNSVEAIVANGDLEKEDIAKIGDLISNATGIPLQNITIIEKNPE